VRDEDRLRYLSIALYVFGAVAVVGVPLLMMWMWPGGFAWEPRQLEYEQMIMGVYATLGVFLILAAKDPLAHRSLIWFTVWSSAVHGAIMLAQAMADDAERANLLGDVPALFVIAAVLGYLMPRERQPSTAAA